MMIIILSSIFLLFYNLNFEFYDETIESVFIVMRCILFFKNIFN
jgi:hypothetical protein